MRPVCISTVAAFVRIGYAWYATGKEIAETNALGHNWRNKFLKRAIKKRDLILIAVALVLIGACLLAIRLMQGGAGQQAEVVIRLDGEEYARLPLRKDTLLVDQGEGRVNEIVISGRGVHMKSATCPNQDCVLQGEVTLDNRHLRPLQGSIVCLPHRLTVELTGEDTP